MESSLPYDTRKFSKDNTELFPAIYDYKSENNKILIAQLGKGGYQTTTYVDESGVELSTTGYGFDAIVGKEKPNKLLLIDTTESGWIGIVDWYGKLKNLTEDQEKQKKKLIDSLKKDDSLEKYQRGEEISKKEMEKEPWLREMLESRKAKGKQSREKLLKKIEETQVKGFQTFQNLVKRQWKKEIIDKLKKN